MFSRKVTFLRIYATKSMLRVDMRARRSFVEISQIVAEANGNENSVDGFNDF